MRLHKEYLSLLLLAEGVQLQHLNQALTGFLNDGHLEMVRKELHAYVEVAEDVVDVAGDFFLVRLDSLVESTEEVVVDVQEQLDAPLVLVREHGLDQLVCLVDYFEVAHLGEGDLLGLDQGFDDDYGVLVEAGMIDLIEISDQLQHLFALVVLFCASHLPAGHAVPLTCSCADR